MLLLVRDTIDGSENSLLDLEEEVQRARNENDRQMDDGKDFGTWNSTSGSNAYTPENFGPEPAAHGAPQLETNGRDNGADFGMPAENQQPAVAPDNNQWVSISTQSAHANPSDSGAEFGRPDDGSDFGGGTSRGGLF